MRFVVSNTKAGETLHVAERVPELPANLSTDPSPALLRGMKVHSSSPCAVSQVLGIPVALLPDLHGAPYSLKSQL